MSSINGSCSQTNSPLHPQLLQQHGLRQQQAQGLQANGNQASPAAPGSGAIQLATSLNAPANTPASAPSSAAEPNKGANIDIHA